MKSYVMSAHVGGEAGRGYVTAVGLAGVHYGGIVLWRMGVTS